MLDQHNAFTKSLKQWFSNFHEPWPPSKDSQHLWPLSKDSQQQNYRVKASARGPLRTALWSPKGSESPPGLKC